MCAPSPKGQLSPGLHQEKCDQQIKGGDTASLLCFHETPPGLLRLVLGPSIQEGMGVVGMEPEEGYEDVQRIGSHPL